MTKIVFKGPGHDMPKLDLLGLLDYLDGDLSPTVARFFDDSLNYTEFTGSGFVFDSNGNPTGGTISRVEVVNNGIAEQVYKGLSLGAVDLLNLANTDDVAGLYAIILAGNDRITGSNAADLLVSGGGNDIIRGRNGSDKILGQGGNDKLYGENGNDRLVGSNGADRLDGGLGKDTMIGGNGADRFYFTTALNNNTDKIKDFSTADDQVYLSNAVFSGTGAAGSTLAAGRFVSSASGLPALDSNDRIIYDESTGDLYYDSDGSGANGAVQFATLTNLAMISASDFTII